MAHLVESLDADRVRANLGQARARIATACERSGRDADTVELLAATKYVPDRLMGVLADAGIVLAGENTLASLERKHESWGERFSFDFIGHLQSRKTKDVLPLARLIHSVESESVLRRIERHALGPTRVLLEVNVSGEASKQGVAPDEVDSFLEVAAGLDRPCFEGLMTMPPFSEDPEQVRRYFVALRELAERLSEAWAPRYRFETLSMGTSQDYAVAVEEGATIVRLGSILYAP